MTIAKPHMLKFFAYNKPSDIQFYYYIILLAVICIATIPQSYANNLYYFDKAWPPQNDLSFIQPFGVAVDPDGAVFVADSFQREIKIYNPDESSNSLEKKWSIQWAYKPPIHGVAVAEIDGFFRVYIIYTLDSKQYEVGIYNRHGTKIHKWYMDDTQINGHKDKRTSPYGIAVNSTGKIYVTDQETHKIRVYETGTGYSHDFQQDSSEKKVFLKPTGIAIGDNDEIYVADSLNNRVVVFDADENHIDTLSTDQVGNKLNYPTGIAVDKEGNTYISDLSDTIHVFDPDGQAFDSWKGAHIGEKALAINAINKQLYIANGVKGQIQAINVSNWHNDGETANEWKVHAAENGFFNSPATLAIDGNRSVYVWDQGNQRIQKFDDWLNFKESWGKKIFTKEGSISLPINEFSSSGMDISNELIHASDMAIDSEGFIYIVDSFNHRVLIFRSDGSFKNSWNKGKFDYLKGIAVSGSGDNRRIYIAITGNGNQRIEIFTAEGKLEYTLEKDRDGIDMPTDIAVDSNNSIYVVEHLQSKVTVYDRDGKNPRWSRNKEKKISNLRYPDKIAIDDYTGRIFITDIDNDETIGDGRQRIQIFDNNNLDKPVQSISSFGTGFDQFMNISGIAVKDNSIFISDTTNNRVQSLSTDGNPKKMKAIVLAGGDPSANNNIWPETVSLANKSWEVLHKRGFEIKYLMSDNDNINNSTNVAAISSATIATIDSLKAAIAWADDATDVVIYMVGHGAPDVFNIHTDISFNSKDLNAWISDLEGSSSALKTVTVVIEACNAGSFLPALTNSTSSTTTHRYLIASTADNQVAILANGGETSFSYNFWSEIANEARLKLAFDEADKSMRLSQSARWKSTKDNGYSICIGECTSYEYTSPTINGNVIANQMGEKIDLKMSISHKKYPIDTAFVNIIAPDFKHEDPNIPSTKVSETVKLKCEQEKGKKTLWNCTGSYTEVQKHGEGVYDFTFYAQNTLGQKSDPKKTYIVYSLDLKNEAVRIHIPDDRPVSANFTKGEKRDWFYFYADSAGSAKDKYNLSITIDPESTTGKINPWIAIFDNDQQIVGKPFQFSENREDISHIIERPGFYYISVSNKSNNTGTYKIGVTKPIAEEKKIVKGVVIDQCTKKRVAGATIVATSTHQQKTSNLGNFTLKLNSGEHTIKVMTDNNDYTEKVINIPNENTTHNMLMALQLNESDTATCNTAAVYDGLTHLLYIDLVKIGNKYYKVQLQHQFKSNYFSLVPNTSTEVNNIATIGNNNLLPTYEGNLLSIPIVHRSRHDSRKIIDYKFTLKRINEEVDPNNWKFEMIDNEEITAR